MGRAVSPVRVRYSETDQMGVAHHASYLPWLEIARTDYLRGCGVPYRALEEMGVRMPVLEVRVQYRSPALYDDLLRVSARLEKMTPVRFSFGYRITREGDDRLIAEGETHHVATDDHGKPRRLPPDLLSRIGGDLVQD